MIIELIQHLKDTLSLQIYPMIMPSDCAKPACVYTIINNRDNQGISGCVSSETIAIQFDIYSKSYKEAEILLDEVKTALYSFKNYPIGINSRDNFETETELFRKIITFSMRDKGI